MKKITGYFKGVAREAKRIRWPKKDAFIPAIAVVLCITVFTALFLALEDYAGGILVAQLKEAFKSIRG